MCTICGVEEESIFHALVTCPKECAFRFAMRDVWNIPGGWRGVFHMYGVGLISYSA